MGLGPNLSVLGGILSVQKGGTLDENEAEIVRDDLNYPNLPLLLQIAGPVTRAGSLKVHAAAGPALEQDWVWGRTGLCAIVLGGVDLSAGPGWLILDLAYNHGLYDLEYTSLGRHFRTRTVSLMVGWRMSVVALWDAG